MCYVDIDRRRVTIPEDLPEFPDQLQFFCEIHEAFQQFNVPVEVRVLTYLSWNVGKGVPSDFYYAHLCIFYNRHRVLLFYDETDLFAPVVESPVGEQQLASDSDGGASPS